MAPAQPVQEVPGFRGQPEPDFALVPDRSHTPEISGRHEAVDESDGAVVTDQELLGELTDRGLESPGCSLNRKQGLVLLRSEPVGPGGRLTENQKLPDMVPEVGKELVILLRQRGLSLTPDPGPPGGGWGLGRVPEPVGRGLVTAVSGPCHVASPVDHVR